MRTSQKIGGFTVEAFSLVDGSRVQWSVRLSDLPYVRAVGPSLPGARQALADQWKKTADAFRAAGQPVPTPKRSRGNKRILDTIRTLGESKSEPIF